MKETKDDRMIKGPNTNLQDCEYEDITCPMCGGYKTPREEEICFSCEMESYEHEQELILGEE